MTTLKPRQKRTGKRSVSGSFAFLVVLALWAGIGWALLYDQSVLTDIWNEFRDLNVLLQIIGWFLFLPWIGAIAIWGADFEQWVRLLLIGAIALFTLVAFAPRPGK